MNDKSTAVLDDVLEKPLESRAVSPTFGQHIRELVAEHLVAVLPRTSPAPRPTRLPEDLD